MDNVMLENIEDVLKQMDRINETFTFEVWVPSLNKTVMFRELTTSQQKRLIKAMIDSPVYNTEFIFTLRGIIKENCTEKIDIDSLSILDKILIALKIRSVCVNDTLEFEYVTDEEGKKITKRTLSIDKIIDQVKDKIKTDLSETISDDNGVYTLDCSIPSIGTEYRLEKELRSNSNIDNIDSNEKLRQTVGDIFINEIVKYINTLHINVESEDGEQEKIINLNDVSFRSRITLIERLPKRLIEKVVDYIDRVSNELDKVLLYKFTIKKIITNNDGKKEEITENVEERLSINSDFFTAS